MAIPSPPTTFYCRNCDWKKTLPMQVGDCRLPGISRFSSCPNCGREDTVEERRAAPLEIAAAHLALIARRR